MGPDEPGSTGDQQRHVSTAMRGMFSCHGGVLQPLSPSPAMRFALPLSAAASALALLVSSSPAAAVELVGDAADAFDVTEHVTNLGPVTGLRFLPDGRLLIIERSGALKVLVPGETKPVLAYD